MLLEKALSPRNPALPLQVDITFEWRFSVWPIPPLPAGSLMARPSLPWHSALDGLRGLVLAHVS